MIIFYVGVSVGLEVFKLLYTWLKCKKEEYLWD